jgi:glycosyltransferase involved in cell wall biosynthesis
MVYEKACDLNADIYHIHDPELLRISAKLIKRNKKVIYDAHEDLPKQIMNKPWISPLLRKGASLIIQNFENKYAKKLSGIIGATSHIRDRFVKINSTVTDINNFPILDRIVPTKKWNEKKNELCYAGGINQIRGAEQMVTAAHRTGTLLNLVGEADDYLLKRLMSMPGWENTNYMGIVSIDEVNEIYSRSKIGLILLHPTPAYIHSLPIKMFEYMAAAIPFIASDFPLWKRIIEKHKCGICVNPLDPNAIAEAIKYLFEHDEEAKQMGMNGRKAVETEYNWSIEEKKLLAFYKKILNE